MINWLKKRLSPVKKGTTRWKELAEAIEEFWTLYFDPDYDRLVALRSIYTADEEDQKAIIVEMGGFFEYDMPADNRPILVAQRKFDLEQKETTVPIDAALRRIGFRGTYEALYARTDQRYGYKFYREADLARLGIDPATCILTSRIALSLELDSRLVSMSTVELALRRVRQIKPLHIIFEGLRADLSISDTVDEPQDGGCRPVLRGAFQDAVQWGEYLHNGEARYCGTVRYYHDGTVYHDGAEGVRYNGWANLGGTRTYHDGTYRYNDEGILHDGWYAITIYHDSVRDEMNLTITGP